MAAPSQILSGVGVRDFQVFVLDANGYPAATSTAAYGGIDVSGVRDVAINDPLPRLIPHIGDDHIFALDTLPPTTPMDGTIKVSKLNNTVDTAITGNQTVTLGEMNYIGVNTDLKGSENQVGIVVYQQAVDTDPSSSNYGARVWQSKIMPRAWVIPIEPGMGDNPTEMNYSLRPQLATKHLWGSTMTTATEGYQQAQLVRAYTANKPRFVAFQADGSTTTFSLGAFGPSVSTSKMFVTDNGVNTTAGVTFTTSAVAFTTAPTSTHMLVVKFEVANTTADNV